jgi:hypothetical protein
MSNTRIPVPHSFPVSPLISRLHLNGAYGTRTPATRRNAERMGGDSSVGTIVPLGSDSIGSDTSLSLYTQEPRVELVVVIHSVCNTHEACAACATARTVAHRGATVRNGAHRRAHMIRMTLYF